LSKVADQIAEWHVEAGALLNEDAGFEVMTEEGFRCAANRLVDELGPSDVFDTFSEIAEPEITTTVLVSYVDAIYVCGDLRRWTASEAVAEIGAALDVELDSEFFDCLVRGLSEEEVRDFSKQQLSNSDPEKIPDDSTIQWVDLGIHTRAEFCAPELAPVLEALLVDRVAQQSIDIDRAEGIDFTTKDEYRCAARRVVDELGINVVSDVLSSVAGAGDIAEFALILVTAQVDCVDQEKWADRMVEWFAATGLSAVERNGAEGLTPDDISCAARRFVDEVGPKVLNDVFNDVFVGAEDIVPFDEFDELGELADELSAALRSCVDLDRFSTPTTPSEETGFPLGKPTSHVLDGDPADLEAVAFSPMNAKIPDLALNATIPPSEWCGDVEFVNSRQWLGLQVKDQTGVVAAWIGYFVVAEVVAESPGPEVITTVWCGGPGTARAEYVYVFAGHTEETIVLGEPISGSLERISDESGVVVADRAWQVGDPHCCATQFEVSEHLWQDGQWVQSWVQYWTLDGQVLDEPLPFRWGN